MTTQEKVISGLALAGLSAILVFGTAGCKAKQDSTQAQIAQQSDTGPDPADANLAPGSGTSGQPTQVLGQSAAYAPQQSGETYAEPPNSDDQYNDYDADASDYSTEPPPPLPEYDQPPSPGPDWYWTPGYWAWGSDGYYWVPGTWVEPPYYGALWTPPYWGWYGGRYLFHRGYWGDHVGFYGGIDYGFGYIGIGYYGGYWRGHDFYYNRSVTNVGGVGNYYNRPVVVNNVHYSGHPENRVSYNGGHGGINVRPRPQEIAARGERHTAPIAEQTQVRNYAAQNRAQSFAQNHGKPDHAAFARPEAAGFNRGAEPNHTGAPVAAGRPGEPNAAANNHAEPNRGPALNNEHTQPARAFNGNRPAENNPAAMHNDHQQPNRAAGAPTPNRAEQFHAAPQQRNEAHPQPAARPEMREARPQPQARPEPQARPQAAPRPQMQGRPAPQMHQAARPAPHVEAPRAAPAPHVEAPHPAPAPHEGGGGEHPHSR